ncbi:MAG: AAA family ATPase, partial [Bullifex sp.]
MIKQKLPIGIDGFEKLIREDFYYVDKTSMISELLSSWSEVNLFTRPRRFGKSLFLSMLYQFFDIDTDKSVFNGLKISEDKSLCDAYMGKYPVIFISLKSIDALTFESAFEKLKILMRSEVWRIRAQIGDEKLSEKEITYLSSFTSMTASEEEYESLLLGLSEILKHHFGKDVIILLDEYDVPLDKAFLNGYYDEMVAFLRGLFGNAFKSNRNLFFAVLTGCMKVSKESIFTGINNMDANTIIDERHDEMFGFTEDDVDRMLESYGLMSRLDDIRLWYDGYRFGSKDIYCPWDVISAVKKLTADPDCELQPFWINTSGNDIIRHFIEQSDRNTKNDIERLLQGETVTRKISMELTYRDMYSSPENLWSVLFTTGYLTAREKYPNGVFSLQIPNREVHEVFVNEISKWFEDSVSCQKEVINELCTAFRDGQCDTAERIINALLSRTISVLDAKAPKGRKENFYHGFLLGLFSGEENWLVKSNSEAGDGFADII